jgi:hypothetical protein
MAESLLAIPNISHKHFCLSLIVIYTLSVLALRSRESGCATPLSLWSMRKQQLESKEAFSPAERLEPRHRVKVLGALRLLEDRRGHVPRANEKDKICRDTRNERTLSATLTMSETHSL